MERKGRYSAATFASIASGTPSPSRSPGAACPDPPPEPPPSESTSAFESHASVSSPSSDSCDVLEQAAAEDTSTKRKAKRVDDRTIDDPMGSGTRPVRRATRAVEPTETRK